MIVNHDKLLPPAIVELMASNFEFHLTGSRFFGSRHGITEKTDWDFFTQASGEVLEYLKSQGYHIESESYAGDCFKAVVMRKEKLVQIDIQLVDHLDLKLRVQDELKRLYPCGLPGDKEFHKEFWFLALNLLRPQQVKVPAETA